MVDHRDARPLGGTDANPLTEIKEVIADLRDPVLVHSRMVSDSGRRSSFDDVLAAFGHTREPLAETADDE
ncbi:hypothetical protein [Goodfellowiella coeruleoviolacea]|uniref:hypothetical protein n=1 Tax=Goodfellowiella coeruleoviolacea TaxID=334858 RepID=UPI0020A41772|nr:hypothetical protein [Goodfellowiella coeruleoviolacea]